ncbi:MAG: hypothetical protein SNJ57_19685 [Cyanobacteriota bacterium]
MKSTQRPNAETWQLATDLDPAMGLDIWCEKRWQRLIAVEPQSWGTLHLITETTNPHTSDSEQRRYPVGPDTEVKTRRR